MRLPAAATGESLSAPRSPHIPPLGKRVFPLPAPHGCRQWPEGKGLKGERGKGAARSRGSRLPAGPNSAGGEARSGRGAADPLAARPRDTAAQELGAAFGCAFLRPSSRLVSKSRLDKPCASGLV